MKKHLSLIALMLVFICLLASCGGNNDKNENEGNNDSNVGNNTTPDDNQEAPGHTHTFGEWMTVTESGCTTEGLKERTCDCGEKETQPIPTEQHIFVEGICEWCGDVDNTPTSNDYFVFTELEDGTYSVAAKDVTNMPKVVVIPAEYNGKAVTVIADYAFVLPPSDGNSEPVMCTNMTNVVIPDSVTSIGMVAFACCINLESIVIPDSVTSIGNNAFSYCSSLTSITISDSVTTIGDYAFHDCSSLTSITIPNSITSIGNYTFYNCSSLTSITIPDSVTSIGNDVFSYCYSLTSITIPDSVTSIGNDAFYGCVKLVEVINKSSLDITAGSSDYGCVGYYAMEIHTHESKIVYLDDYLFYAYNGINYLLGYVGSDTALVLPDNYNGENYEIYQYAFYDCDSITSITIPDSVTSIGDYAFAACYNLTTITIPDGVTSIGDYAFGACTGLTSITIPNSVTSIGNDAFYYCSSLTDVYYTGTEEEWAAISIGSSNEDFTNSNIHYNYVPEE